MRLWLCATFGWSCCVSLWYSRCDESEAETFHVIFLSALIRGSACGTSSCHTQEYTFWKWLWRTRQCQHDWFQSVTRIITHIGCRREMTRWETALKRRTSIYFHTDINSKRNIHNLWRIATILYSFYPSISAKQRDIKTAKTRSSLEPSQHSLLLSTEAFQNLLTLLSISSSWWAISYLAHVFSMQPRLSTFLAGGR